MPTEQRDVEAEILHQAAELFRCNSYHGTSMQHLAEAAHLRKASLYHYFSSKEDILLRIAGDLRERVLPELSSIAAGPLPATEKLRQALLLHARTVLAHRGEMSALLLEYRGVSPETQRRLQSTREEYQAAFAGILREGVAAGVFLPTNVELAVMMVLGMCNWLIVREATDDPVDPDVMTAELAAFALRGLGVLTPSELRP